MGYVGIVCVGTGTGAAGGVGGYLLDKSDSVPSSTGWRRSSPHVKMNRRIVVSLHYLLRTKFCFSPLRKK